MGGGRQKPRSEPPGPHNPLASSESSEYPGMCLLPSECPWLYREGKIGERGAFTQLCTHSFLPSPQGAGGFKVPLASLSLILTDPLSGAKAEPGKSLSLEQG